MTFDPYDPEPDYDMSVYIQTEHGAVAVAPGDADPAEETYRLALESAQRWLNNYRLSPAMRLRALRSVVGAALATEGS